MFSDTISGWCLKLTGGNSDRSSPELYFPFCIKAMIKRSVFIIILIIFLVGVMPDSKSTDTQRDRSTAAIGRHSDTAPSAGVNLPVLGHGESLTDLICRAL